MDGEQSTSPFTRHLMSACLVLVVVVVVGIVVVGFNVLRCQTDISGTRPDKDLNICFCFVCLFVFLTRFGCITS